MRYDIATHQNAGTSEYATVTAVLCQDDRLSCRESRIYHPEGGVVDQKDLRQTL